MEHQTDDQLEQYAREQDALWNSINNAIEAAYQGRALAQLRQDLPSPAQCEEA